jgi:hypothetical protein
MPEATSAPISASVESAVALGDRSENVNVSSVAVYGVGDPKDGSSENSAAVLEGSNAHASNSPKSIGKASCVGFCKVHSFIFSH